MKVFQHVCIYRSRRLVFAYESDGMNGQNIAKCIREIREGRINVHDEERSGWPYLLSDDFVQKVKLPKYMCFLCPKNAYGGIKKKQNCVGKMCWITHLTFTTWSPATITCLPGWKKRCEGGGGRDLKMTRSFNSSPRLGCGRRLWGRCTKIHPSVP